VSAARPDVTVVVVAYRSRHDLPSCLDSVAAEVAGLAVETVVVENGSADGTLEWLREHSAATVLLENPSNRGFAAAANQGAGVARGRRLLFLNPDARLLPGCLRALVEALDQCPEAGLAGAQLQYQGGSPQPSAWLEPGLASLAFEALFLYNLFPRARLYGLFAPGLDPVAVPTLSGACLLLDTAFFRQLGGFDERFFLYFEDTDLSLRARALGRTLLLVPKAQAAHAIGGSAFQDRRDFLLRFHDSRRLFLRKHHAGVQAVLLHGVHVFGLGLRVPAYGLASAWGGRALRERAEHHAAVLRRLWARAPRDVPPFV
jgi:N-acetylglucosaminyl-diphospho-decaprenol L-rhamnosyltransferase